MNLEMNYSKFKLFFPLIVDIVGIVGIDMPYPDINTVV